MTEYCRLIEMIDLSLFKDEVMTSPLWVKAPMPGGVFKHRSEIRIRTPIARKDGTYTLDRRYDGSFPKLVSFLNRWAEPRGTLGCIVLGNLKPGGEVLEHVDQGRYYDERDRHHIVLESEGSLMTWEGRKHEQVFKTGELWWYNNHVKHAAYNTSPAVWRMHVIFDILPRASES